jgi:REP element-mobilizing transposase RayT
MGQTLIKNYIHIVFSTKHRKPLITEDIEEELFAYIVGVCNNLECYSVRVGGYLNHIHILCHLSKKIALTKLVETVKANSSKWIKTKGSEFQTFYWQNGFGAFSVGYKQVEPVLKYIANQKEHHQKTKFKDEYRNILQKNEVEFNEQYVWD